MTVLGICGSFREESNTNKLVKLVAQSSQCNYDLVYLGKTRAGPCTGCMRCAANGGQCVIDDGMQQIYDKLLAADGIVVGSPTFREDVTGAVKCFIDRTIALYYRGIGPASSEPHTGTRPLAERPAVAVVTTAAVGAARAAETLRLYFEINRMKVAALLPEVVGIQDVDEMPDVTARAAEAGKKLGQALRLCST